MANKPDYYQILGIERNATQQEIKEAYRFKVFTLHPDRVTEPFKNRAEEELKIVNIAYEILGDPQRRVLYDSELDQEDQSKSSQENHSINDIIFNFLTVERRKELIIHLRELIYDGYEIEYNSKGYIAYQTEPVRICHRRYLADEATPGDLYIPSQIAISLKVPQAEVQAALYGLTNTAYIYKNYGKYGVTPKYFEDHPEIYYVYDHGMAIQKEKDQADRLKKQAEKDQADRLKKQADQAEQWVGKYTYNLLARLLGGNPG